MSYYVYILLSDSVGKYYIGQTVDLERRLSQHNSEENTGWTRRYQPWALYWKITLLSRSSAIELEKYLKKKPRSFLKRLKENKDLQDYIIERYG